MEYAWIVWDKWKRSFEKHDKKGRYWQYRMFSEDDDLDV